MGFGKLALTAACVFILKGCRVYGQSIAAAEAISITGSAPGSSCLGGGQFIIPAIIKPVLAPEPPSAPIIPDFGLGNFGGTGYGNYPPTMPPIILDEGGGSNWNHLLYLIILLRGLGGGCGGGCGYGGGFGGGCGGGCGGGYGGGYGRYGGCSGGCGGYGCGGGCGGYNGYGGYGYNSGCGCGCGGGGGCGCNSPYNGYGNCGGSCDSSCGCGYDDMSGSGSGCSCSSPNEINLIIRTDSSSSTSSTTSK